MNNEILLSNIRDLCKKNNTTVANLEKIMGIGAGTISRWNKANPTFDKVLAIARYFKVSIDYLSGYTISSDEEIKVDENTEQVIAYLLSMTNEAEENKSFWHEYGKKREKELLISGLRSMNLEKGDISKLLCASDENGYYLLEIIHYMNDCYEYETMINLYLVPDEVTIPVLECNIKSALQTLHIAAMKHLELSEVQQEAQGKAKTQRDNIIKKFNNLNK